LRVVRGRDKVFKISIFERVKPGTSNMAIYPHRQMIPKWDVVRASWTPFEILYIFGTDEAKHFKFDT